MAGTDVKAYQKAISDYHKAILDEVEERCKRLCNALCEVAIEKRYKGDTGAPHNFTGNLLNSIVVCLYRQQKPVYACYAADKVAKAIQVKMTARKKPYWFKQDYDGGPSQYTATIETNQGWGEDDAREFFAGFRPSGNNSFDIVVAYPVEYAEYVDALRGTVGILKTYTTAQTIGSVYLMLPKAA